QLPLKSYRALDGLPHEIVQRIVRDSRGFLWFCTALGLARFDGYRFTTYGKQKGLSYKYTNTLIETRSGDYWVGTNGGGTYLFHPGVPSSGSSFIAYPVGDNQATNRVNALFEDRSGRIWAGTDAGLFRLEPGGKEFLPVAL